MEEFQFLLPVIATELRGESTVHCEMAAFSEGVVGEGLQFVMAMLGEEIEGTRHDEWW